MAAKDESAEEKGLGKIITTKLQEQLQTEPSGCPEAETLSAYFERTLSQSEQMVCESHLMTCSRCQLYVAELARLSEADERPVIVGDVEIPTEEATGWSFRLAWVAPVLVVLIVAGVWFREEIRNRIRPPQEEASEEPAPGTTRPSGEAPSGKGKKAAAPVRKPDEEMANKVGTEQKEQATAGAAPNAPAPAEGRARAGGGISIKGVEAESAQGRAPGRAASTVAETRVLQIPAGARQAEAADRALAAAAPPQTKAAPMHAREGESPREAGSQLEAGHVNRLHHPGQRPDLPAEVARGRPRADPALRFRPRLD